MGYVYAPGHQGLKSRTNSILADCPRLRLYRPIGASGAEQMDRASVSPGGLVMAALQQEVLTPAVRPKAALVPYCSEGWGPAGNRDADYTLVEPSGGMEKAGFPKYSPIISGMSNMDSPSL